MRNNGTIKKMNKMGTKTKKNREPTKIKKYDILSSLSSKEKYCKEYLEPFKPFESEIEEIFKKNSPSALILVSVLGLVPDMDRVIELCNKYDVILLEDVCESMGSKYKDKYLGTFGLASFFSMYFGHHLSTIEGGFINTNDEEFYYALLMMRSHGWTRDLPTHIQNEYQSKYNVSAFDNLYNFYLPGKNLRSTDLQAFFGLRAIDKLDKFSKIRNSNFNHYINNINYLFTSGHLYSLY